MAARRRTWPRLAALAAVGLCVVILAAGCGSSSSHKPAFCDDLSSLQKSVGEISVTGGLSSVKNQLAHIETQSRTLVTSAKHDFAGETTAVQTAASALQAHVKAASSSPTPSQLATVAGDLKSLARSVGDLASASKSACQ